MPMRLSLACRTLVSAAALACLACFAGCAESPADRVPLKDVPVERIVKQGYTQPEAGKIPVDVRRERGGDIVVKFRDVLVYVDGDRVSDLMSGERIVFYLSPGMHRIAVSTQFDPVIELPFMVTDRYTDHALVSFDPDHRVQLRRVPK